MGIWESLGMAGALRGWDIKGVELLAGFTSFN